MKIRKNLSYSITGLSHNGFTTLHLIIFRSTRNSLNKYLETRGCLPEQIDEKTWEELRDPKYSNFDERVQNGKP